MLHPTPFNIADPKVPATTGRHKTMPCLRHITIGQYERHPLQTAGLPDKKKVQKIQNSTARLVIRFNRFDHIKQLLQELHWLPVSQRIVFKIQLLVYKSINRNGPSYLTDLLHPLQQEQYSLRSTNQNLLMEPTANKTYCDRAFSVCGWKLWKELPLCIRERGSIAVFKI